MDAVNTKQVEQLNFFIQMVLDSTISALYVLEESGVCTEFCVGKGFYAQDVNFKAHTGKNILDISPPHIAKEFRDYIQLTLKNQKSYSFEYNYQTETDLKLVRQASFIPYNENHILAIVQDITKQRQAEQALQSSEEIHRSLLEQASDGIFISDNSNKYIVVNDKACEMTGYSKEELLKLTIFDLTFETPTTLTPEYSKRLLNGETLLVERQVHRKDGQILPVEANVRLLENGLLQAIMRDISERKRTEEALRESELRFFKLFQAAPSPTILTRVRDGKIYDANESFVRLLGYSREEALSKNSVDLIWGNAAERDAFVEILMQDRVFYDYEVMAKTKSGEPRNLLASAAFISLESEDVIITAFVDITARKQAEKELRKSEELFRQSQKMEAIGRLAGGVAHDFNNLLTVILTYSEFILSNPDLDNLTKDDTLEIRKAAEQAASLTRQLLIFSRKQTLNPSLLNLNQTIDEITQLLHRLIGEDIELVTKTEAHGLVLADAGQIKQVIMNLAVNARDAMPEGGVLTIETSDVVLSEEDTDKCPTLHAGPFVNLTLSDTGVGMDAETRNRLFEPFFTTKEPGKGTGLGLATVYGIVNQSTGFISLESELGVGTSFHIYLPQADPQTEKSDEQQSKLSSLHGTETILLVEDDEKIRELALRILNAQGYKVLIAANGEEALRLLWRNTQEIALLITDIVMPHLGGKRLVDYIRQQNSNLQVLYMSGYIDQTIIQQATQQQNSDLLEKPFKPLDLLHKVRDLLDRTEK